MNLPPFNSLDFYFEVFFGRIVSITKSEERPHDRYKNECTRNYPIYRKC